jgi:hypothetical protein
MWLFAVIGPIGFALAVLYAIFLHRFMARMTAAEQYPITIQQAIDAADVFAVRRETRERRRIVWRYGKPFYVVSVLSELLIIAGALVMLFFVVLRSIYGSA